MQRVAVELDRHGLVVEIFDHTALTGEQVARNEAQGSCIIDRKGDILAWNEGDREVIEVTLAPEDG